MTDWHSRKLGQARADLVALPDLIDELARTLTERHHDISNYQTKIIGSPAPLQLPVVHLTDTRHKPGWHGDDPRHERITDRYGVTPVLEAWVRVIWEETDLLDLTEHATVRSETAVLLEHWDWITNQPWADDIADDITRLAAQVRDALGIRPEYRPRCWSCHNLVHPVEAETHNLTTWEAAAFGKCSGCGLTYPKGPALDALAQVQPGMSLRQISDTIGVPVKTLHRWHNEGLIAPVEDRHGQLGRLFDLATVSEVAAKLRTRDAS